MKIRPCPRCQQHTLVQTSVFWACNACQLAITTVALSIETQQTKGTRSLVPAPNERLIHTAMARRDFGGAQGKEDLMSLVSSVGMIALTLIGVWLCRYCPAFFGVTCVC